MTVSRDKLIESAKKLDRQLGNESTFFTKVNEIIIDHSDTNKVADLYKSIYLFQKENKISKISQTLKELSDNLACYLGYSYLFEILGKELGKRNNSSLDELMKELNQLVGLQKVKEEVSRLVIYQKVQSKRKESGLKVPKRTLHMAFMGNPGTGKTTVARIVGRMYYQLGLLSKGHFTEVSRTDLIAGYQGQTALKVKNVIEKAKGGVLFIDEAYSITENENTDSYGRECLTELTKALEDSRDDLIVIVAGYTDPMNHFFESNPGLKSRFNYFINFENYSSMELLDILETLARKDDYQIEDKLKKILLNYNIKLLQDDKLKYYFDYLEEDYRYFITIFLYKYVSFDKKYDKIFFDDISYFRKVIYKEIKDEYMTEINSVSKKIKEAELDYMDETLNILVILMVVSQKREKKN